MHPSQSNILCHQRLHFSSIPPMPPHRQGSLLPPSPLRHLPPPQKRHRPSNINSQGMGDPPQVAPPSPSAQYPLSVTTLILPPPPRVCGCSAIVMAAVNSFLGVRLLRDVSIGAAPDALGAYVALGVAYGAIALTGVIMECLRGREEKDVGMKPLPSPLPSPPQAYAAAQGGYVGGGVRVAGVKRDLC
jgi:hypothetical protein